MSGLGRAVDRGLHVVGRIREDWSPFALFVVLVAAVFGLAAAIWITVARYTAHDWHVFGVYVLSEFLLVAFARDKTKKIRDLDGEVLVWTIDAITRHSYILDLRDRMPGDALGAALWGAGIGAGLLIGTVFVTHIVHWRKARRRRGAREKRTTPASRRWIGPRFKSIPRFLSMLLASVRLAWKAIARYAVAGSAGPGNGNPAAGNRHAHNALAIGLEQGRAIPAPPAAFDDPTVGPLAAARSARQGRPSAAEVPPGEAHPGFDQRPDGEAHLVPRETPPSARSPAAPTVSPPAALDNSANPRCSEPTSREPHSPAQDSHDVGARKGGDSAPPETGRTQERVVAVRENSSEDAAPSAPKGERTASGDRIPGSNERPLGTRPGARRRRPKASQDFY